MDNLKIIIPGKPEYLTMIRLTASSLASMAGFNLEDTDDIKMAVAEACKNVSCHGEQGLSDKYELSFKVDEGYFEVNIVDACDCHTLKKEKPLCKHCPQEGDIGVIVIRSLMDSVEFGRDDDNHKYINMVKRK
ncbi:MAG: ATP-binding protein [Eubacterium sp.]|nr:ATP-binding protein [Eubacterium sp.]